MFFGSLRQDTSSSWVAVEQLTGADVSTIGDAGHEVTSCAQADAAAIKVAANRTKIRKRSTRSYVVIIIKLDAAASGKGIIWQANTVNFHEGCGPLLLILSHIYRTSNDQFGTRCRVLHRPGCELMVWRSSGREEAMRGLRLPRV